MDLLSLIILLGAVQGVFLALLLWRRTPGWPYLMIFLLASSLHLAGNVLYGTRLIENTPHLILVRAPLVALFGPMLFLYVWVLVYRRMLPLRRAIPHFMPFVASVLFFLPFYVQSAAAKLSYLERSYSYGYAPWLLGFFLMAAVLNLTYAVIAIRMLWRARPIHFGLNWARLFLGGFAGIFSIVLVLTPVRSDLAEDVADLGYSVLVYGMAYRVARRPETLEQGPRPPRPLKAAPAAGAEPPLPAVVPTAPAPESNSRPKYEKSGLDETAAGEYLAQLDRIMAEEQLFRDAELNLQRLARRLQLSTYSLSQLLNQYRGQSFSDYINQLRINYFIEALRHPGKQQYSLLALAYEAGFNSKATFNAVFKKMTGHTPSDYRREMLG